MLNIKSLPEDLQKVATEELGEVPERIPEDLKALRTWIEQQPHLKARTDDQFLVQFLRGCKYSLEKAKRKIDYFYSVKTNLPVLERHYNVDDPSFRKLHSAAVSLPLPTPLNENGPRILFTQTTFNPKEYSALDIYKYASNQFDILQIRDPYACIQGLVFVVNCAKITTTHLAMFTVSDLKAIFTACEKGMPMRIKSIILTDVPQIAENFVKVLIPFLPEKFRNRIHVCGNNIEALGEVLPKKYLPRDYGGENGFLDDVCREYNKVWDEYREYFKVDIEYGVDESLRLGTPHEINSELGVGGSFRKINVD